VRHFYWAKAIIVLALLGSEERAGAQSLKRVNRKLSGQILDFTQNHGRDNRIYSTILGQPRDLYVYLPPGYDETKQYSLILWFHGAFGDEHAFLTQCQLCDLDRLIARGCCPPTIVACPDGTYGGTNRLMEQHSFFINGLGGRFEDHVIEEVLPFLMANFSIRPEREAHAIAGISAGGFGALSVAIRRRDLFGIVSTIGAPVHMRYYNCQGRYFANFRPETYRARTYYDPNEVVARFFGIVQIRARRLVEHAFGPPDQLVENITRLNPADLLFEADLKPHDLEIYVNYPSHDNFNFDAQAESFAWLASQKGVGVHLLEDRLAQHLLPYFRRNQLPTMRWLCERLLPPLETQSGATSQKPAPSSADQPKFQNP
jgi:hypothetical protein